MTSKKNHEPRLLAIALEELVVSYVESAKVDWEETDIFEQPSLNDSSNVDLNLIEEIRSKLCEYFEVCGHELDELYERFIEKYIEHYNRSLESARTVWSENKKVHIKKLIDSLTNYVTNELIGQQLDEEELDSSIESICCEFSQIEDEFFEYENHVRTYLMDEKDVAFAYRAMCEAFVVYFSDQEFDVIYEFFVDVSTLFEHIIAMSLGKNPLVPLWCSTWDDETEKKEALFIQLTETCLNNVVQLYRDEAYSKEFYENRVSPLVGYYLTKTTPTLTFASNSEVANLQQLVSWITSHLDSDWRSFLDISKVGNFVHNLLKLFPEDIFIQNPMQQLFENE